LRNLKYNKSTVIDTKEIVMANFESFVEALQTHLRDNHIKVNVFKEGNKVVVSIPKPKEVGIVQQYEQIDVTSKTLDDVLRLIKEKMAKQ
jgi:hypothetical protein